MKSLCQTKKYWAQFGLAITKQYIITPAYYVKFKSAEDDVDYNHGLIQESLNEMLKTVN